MRNMNRLNSNINPSTVSTVVMIQESPWALLTGMWGETWATLYGGLVVRTLTSQARGRGFDPRAG